MSENFSLYGQYATRPPVALMRALRSFRLLNRPVTNREVRKTLLALRQIMQTGHGTITKSFPQSRFTSTAVIWRKKQRSCGSYSTMVASVMRYYGLRCKLIDGYLGPPKEGCHHAWNEIYIPAERKYVAFDITRPSLRIGKRHHRKHVWADWSDLEKVYDPKNI